MLKNLWLWVINNVFKRKTETTNKEISDNEKFADDYKKIDEINFNAIVSNKLANYTASDSTLSIDGDSQRAIYLEKIRKLVWRKLKKIASMTYGNGGVALVPYTKNGKIYYNIVTQDRILINKMEGDLITGATILSDEKVVSSAFTAKTYIRWTDYNVENNKITISQRYTEDNTKLKVAPEFWQGIPDSITISNVDRVTFGFIISPTNNRQANDKYGVPITYGCDSTIEEIKECLKQIRREFDLKQVFVGADRTMFADPSKGKEGLPSDGLYRKVDGADDGFWEIFDPAIRESSYYNRLQELYRRLENEMNVSAGILSELKTQNATATEIKKSMKETFDLCDDMRNNIEKGLEDFFYACNVIANAYRLSPQGEYNLKYDWSYSLIEDSQTEFNQKTQAVNMGIEKKAELRNWLHPSESMEESEKIIKEIEAEEPTAEDIINE